MMQPWHDFFIMVGGGAAALAGLVFVALSINLGTIVADPTHKNRAIGTLTGFSAVFIICGFALIADQEARWFGIEWFLVSCTALYIYVRGIFRAAKSGASWFGVTNVRVTAGVAGYAGQIVGALMLAMGYSVGIYVASIAMVLAFASLVSGAWLLMVGAHEGQSGH